MTDDCSAGSKAKDASNNNNNNARVLNSKYFASLSLFRSTFQSYSLKKKIGERIFESKYFIKTNIIFISARMMGKRVVLARAGESLLNISSSTTVAWGQFHKSRNPISRLKNKANFNALQCFLVFI